MKPQGETWYLTTATSAGGGITSILGMGFFSVKRPLQHDADLVYELVELRRQNFDTMLWQVPAIAFAGQALIFTVLLSQDAAWWARIIAGTFSIGLSVGSLLLLARHRQAEEADAEWLAAFEEQAGWPDDHRQHGPRWRERREKVLPGPAVQATGRRTGWGRIPLVNTYVIWVITFWFLIGLALVATVSGGLGRRGALESKDAPRAAHPRVRDAGRRFVSIWLRRPLRSRDQRHGGRGTAAPAGP